MAKQFGKSDRWILSGEEYEALQKSLSRDTKALQERLNSAESWVAQGRGYKRQYDELLVQFRALVKQHHEAAIEHKTALLILEDLSQERYGTSKLSEMLKEQAKHVKAHGALNIPSKKAHSDAYQHRALFGDELGDIRPAAGIALDRANAFEQQRAELDRISLAVARRLNLPDSHVRELIEREMQYSRDPALFRREYLGRWSDDSSDAAAYAVAGMEARSDALPRQQLVLRNISYGEPSLDRVGASDLVPDDAGSDDSSDDAGDDADDSTG